MNRCILHIACPLIVIVGVQSAFSHSDQWLDVIRQLEDPDPEICGNAVCRLLALDWRSSDAVPSLIAALDSRSERVRSSTQQALARIGFNAVPALLSAAKSENLRVRQLAIEALGGIGHEACDSVPCLAKLSRNPNIECLATIAQALGGIASLPDVAVPVLLHLLKDHDSRVRRAAAQSLGQFAPEATQAIPLLLDMLNDEDFRTRRVVMDSLGRFGTAAREAIPTLVIRLQDMRRDETLSRSRSKSALQILEMSLVINTIGMIGSDTVEVVGVLIEIIQIKEPILRRCALEALGRVEGDAKAAIPLLFKATQSRKPSIVCYATLDLAKIGSPAIPALERILEECEGSRYRYAALALGAITSDLPKLVKALKNEDYLTRWMAVQLLADQGPTVRNTVTEALVAMLEVETDDRVRETAMTSLGLIQASSAPAISALLAAIGDENAPNLAKAATMALRRTGIRSEATLDLLLQALLGQSELQLKSVAKILSDLGPKDKALVPVLTKALKQKPAIIRWHAANVLGRIGPAAKDALPRLQALSRDELESVRLKAADAIKKINGHPQDLEKRGCP